MKIKFSALSILCFGLSISLFAQNNDFEIKVFSQKVGLNKNNKSVLLVIKRKPQAEFDTNQRFAVRLYLLKCPKTENCRTIGDEYVAVGSIKGKKLAKNETIALSMNLADFYWKPAMSSIDVQNPAPNFSNLPKENIYFYVEINVCKKPETKEKKTMPVCAEYTSNEIVLNLKQ